MRSVPIARGIWVLRSKLEFWKIGSMANSAPTDVVAWALLGELAVYAFVPKLLSRFAFMRIGPDLLIPADAIRSLVEFDPAPDGYRRSAVTTLDLARLASGWRWTSEYEWQIDPARSELLFWMKTRIGFNRPLGVGRLVLRHDAEGVHVRGRYWPVPFASFIGLIALLFALLPADLPLGNRLFLMLVCAATIWMTAAVPRGRLRRAMQEIVVQIENDLSASPRRRKKQKKSRRQPEMRS